MDNRINEKLSNNKVNVIYDHHSYPLNSHCYIIITIPIHGLLAANVIPFIILYSKTKLIEPAKNINNFTIQLLH